MKCFSIDIFFKLIHYLSFEDTYSLCNSSKLFWNYSTNEKYKIDWKVLTDKMLQFVYDYNIKLIEIRKKLQLQEGMCNNFFVCLNDMLLSNSFF